MNLLFAYLLGVLTYFFLKALVAEIRERFYLYQLRKLMRSK